MKQIIATIALAVASIGTADATTFDFSYTTQSGITAGGTVEATGFGTFYSVDDVAGTRDGAAITRYDFDDPTPQSFNYMGGQPNTVDFSYYVGADNYEIRFPGNGSSFGTEFRTDASGAVTSLLVTRFSLTPAVTAVPEPAAWTLMLVGVGGIGFAMRRRQSARPSVAFAA